MTQKNKKEELESDYNNAKPNWAVIIPILIVMLGIFALAFGLKKPSHGRLF